MIALESGTDHPERSSGVLEPSQITPSPGAEVGAERSRELSARVARQQYALLTFVAGFVLALVAFGVQPYVAVSTAFGVGLAAIELQRQLRANGA